MPMSDRSRPIIDHLDTLDALRVIAAFGVVYFHIVPTPDRFIGYAGLAVFLLSSATVLTMKPRHQDFRAYVGRRARRLLVPWLAWSAIYLSAKGVSKLRHGEALLASIDLGDLLIGPSIHLWYLPFAFVMAIALWNLPPVMNKQHRLILMAILTVLSVLLLGLYGWLPSRFNLVAPVGQWLYGLPSVTLGATLGLIMRSPNNRLIRCSLILCTVVIDLACIGLMFAGHYDVAVSYGIAIALICLSLMFRQYRARWVRTLSDLTLGIYLIHPLIIIGWDSFVKVNLPVRTFAILVFLLSAASTVVLRRIPGLRQIV